MDNEPYIAKTDGRIGISWSFTKLFNCMSDNKKIENIDKQCRNDLEEICHFYGGWDELRKVIDSLEENENEAAYERYINDHDGNTTDDDQHRMIQSQKLK